MNRVDPIPIRTFERQKKQARNDVPNDNAEPRPPEFTDDALALRFADRHAPDARYVDAHGKWLLWTGKKWEPDETRLIWNHVRKVCREASAECNEPRPASALASATTVAAVERLARSDRRLAATVNQWDADIFLLNTQGGIVDLRTGNMQTHDAMRYMTKITAVAPGGDCELWHRVLHRATDGDEALQKFIQRMVGYCLTGDTSAHALFFFFGTGANSKSVILDTIAGVFGDYHRTAPIETFTASAVDRHPTDLAGLHGARLVTSVETEEGRRWAESRIKQLTGGDKVSARFMRRDFFEFTPQFKLIIAGNHKPSIRSVDEAIRRRFHMLPFTVTIPPNERDLKLKEKLKAEWPGILAWAIRGCLEWQDKGLDAPGTVQDATAAYLEAEDATAAWIEECCDRDAQGWETSTALYSSWKAWAERTGEFAGSTKRFVQALEGRGFHPKKTRTGRGFEGLKLLNRNDNQPHWSDQ